MRCNLCTGLGGDVLGGGYLLDEPSLASSQCIRSWQYLYFGAAETVVARRCLHLLFGMLNIDDSREYLGSFGNGSRITEFQVLQMQKRTNKISNVYVLQ